MNTTEAMKKMRELVDTLNEASDAYYNGQQERMSDYEWDAAFDALKKLEEETGTVLEDSPTINVSSDDTQGLKEPHEFPALSLAKTKKVTDLVKWASDRPIFLSWKLDGLTLVVTYDNGKLTKVVTRGDGHVGTNITHLASAIHGIQKTIKEKGHLVIRGEAVISYEDFEQFVLESGEDYANPRNLASGSLSLKDSEEVKRRNIHWIPFTLVYTEKTIVSWGEQMQYLRDLGFTVVDHEVIQTPSYENISGVIDAWTKKVTNHLNPYPVDGLVITYDDTQYASTGSITGHHATRAGYAFKWADESVDSTLDHIEWSCAASTITPVAVFEPVELEGTTVKRASLCNISECERLGIGAKGTVVSVIKANKIIPKIIHVSKIEGKLEIPSVCPVCRQPTEIHVSENSGTKTLKCTNPDCAAKKLKKFRRFVSKGGMDIERKLLNAEDLNALVEKASTTEDIECFAYIDGIGSEKSSAFVKWFQDEKNLRDYQDLLQYLTVNKTAAEAVDDKCKNLTFVVTGDVHHYKNRNELKAYIEAHGGKVTGSVSKSTNYLINNDVTSTSSKNTKAKSLGVPIISEDEFIAQFGE